MHNSINYNTNYSVKNKDVRAATARRENRSRETESSEHFNEGRPCPVHPEMEALFVCKDCEAALVCKHCATTAHSGHHFVEIKDFVFDQRDVIIAYIEEAEIELKRIFSNIQTADTKIEDNGKLFQDLVVEIERQGKDMKEQIDRITGKYIIACHKIEGINAENLTNYKKELEELYDKMNNVLENCKGVMESGSEFDIISTGRDIPNKIKFPVDPVVRNAQFEAGAATAEQMVKVFGVVVIEGDDDSSGEDGIFPGQMHDLVEMVSEFKFHSNIHSLCPTGENAWLLEHLADEVFLLNHAGDTLRSVKCKTRINDISISPINQSLWMACDDKIIREVEKASFPFDRFRVVDRALAICVTIEGKIVVGMENKVTVYNTQGHICHTMNKFSPSARLVKGPHHITMCRKTGDIAIINSRSHLLVVDRLLRFKLYHRGKTFTTKNGNIRDSDYNAGRITAYDVCYSADNSLFFTSRVNRSVMVMKNNGSQLQTIVIDDLEPHAIGVQSNGLLWVGFDEGNVKIMKLNLLAIEELNTDRS